ncbi:LOW QUALITY PROTEIN: hypothetical protein Cgig2_028048 [Carnegiea gigantea]|uniref:Uncharacterized protein n=1 Tax=Carnegiea gigantea TaxID=171969 RepID=A0A9Q1JSF5_9CARY|nr:LOW QUALITY PROTEIN: hypothetical protein Cgig2_028048 [Carnegiea gigantea]
MTPKSRSTPSFEEGEKQKIECPTLVVASALARRDLFTDPENMDSQVTEQVKKAMEAANSARPLPHFDYVPTTGCELSHRHVPVVSHRHSDEVREVTHPDGNDRSWGENLYWNGRPLESSPEPGTTSEVNHGLNAICHAFLMHCLVQGAGANLEFYEQNGRTTAECRELRKALHELSDNGQIDSFLKRGPRFLRKECEPAWLEPREEEYSTEIVAAITGGYAEGITQSTWKA